MGYSNIMSIDHFYNTLRGKGFTDIEGDILYLIHYDYIVVDLIEYSVLKEFTWCGDPVKIDDYIYSSVVLL